MKCRVCDDRGIESIPIYDDWGEVSSFVNKPCDVCGGTGTVDEDEYAEMRACYGPEYMW